jgi:hypothetical protein
MFHIAVSAGAFIVYVSSTVSLASGITSTIQVPVRSASESAGAAADAAAESAVASGVSSAPPQPSKRIPKQMLAKRRMGMSPAFR